MTPAFPVRYRGAVAALLLLLVTAASAAYAQSALPPGFVYLRDVDPSIAQDIRYATRDNFTGRPLPGHDAAECVLIRAAANALKQVQADLAASGLGLKVYDCYRPARATRAMVQWAYDGRTENRRFHPALPKPALLSGYIAGHSRHASGTTVDLTLVELSRTSAPAFDPRASYGACNGPVAQRSPESGLDMGTGYDCFDPMSHTNSAAISPEQRARRQRLVEAMRKRGFRNYPNEWWHFTLNGEGSAPPYDLPIRPR
jgi:D-alanyl-D-alanine dipeptidase